MSALQLFYGGQFTLSTQLIIPNYVDIQAVWSTIIPNCRTTGIIYEYITLMHIVQPSVPFTKPKKLVRVSIRFIEWLTTSWTQKPKLLKGLSSQQTNLSTPWTLHAWPCFFCRCKPSQSRKSNTLSRNIIVLIELTLICSCHVIEWELINGIHIKSKEVDSLWMQYFYLKLSYEKWKK